MYYGWYELPPLHRSQWGSMMAQKLVTIYQAEDFCIMGIESDSKEPLLSRLFYVDCEFGLRFQVNLSYKSEVTFLCLRCEMIPPEVSFDFLSTKNLSILTPAPNFKNLSCSSCSYRSPLHKKIEVKYNGGAEYHHETFTWSDQFTKMIERYVDLCPESDVLSGFLAVEELCDVLISIKGKLESARINRLLLENLDRINRSPSQRYSQFYGWIPAATGA